MALLHRVQTPPRARAPRRRLVVERSDLSPDDRRAAWPRGAARHRRPRRRRSRELTFDDDTFGVLVQYPDERGRVVDLRPFIEQAHAAGVEVAVGTDLLALALLTPPGEMGADVVIRQLPALRRAARLRRPACRVLRHAQGFRPSRSRAASSACRWTPTGARRIGWRSRRANSTSAARRPPRTSAPRRRCSRTWPRCTPCTTGRTACGRSPSACTIRLVRCIRRWPRPGLRQLNDAYFDTLCVECPGGVSAVRQRAEAAGINLRYLDDRHVGHRPERARDRGRRGRHRRRRSRGSRRRRCPRVPARPPAIPAVLVRTTPFLTHPVFNSHRSETQMMRYIRHLERKDLGSTRR